MPNDYKRSSELSRRHFAFTYLSGTLCFSAPVLHGQTRKFDLLTTGVSEIQAAVASGALTYEQLVRLYLTRINTYDKRGPHLNSIIEINPKAIDIARALDEERRSKGLRSPLHGIPIAIKDNVDVKDMPSAGGSVAFAGTFPARDATIIHRLRQSGAIIFLKTNMDELALGSCGLSSLGGQILNPHDLERNPGGSSGGTAVAVNAGFAPLGIATETGFSIRSPASNNALIGIAPTRGLVSRAGVMPISFTQDRVGVHAKSVPDAALLLSYLRGFDPEDLSTADSLGHVDLRLYTEYLNRPLDGRRLGVLRDLFRKGEEYTPGNKVVESQITLLRNNGAIVLDGLSTGVELLSLMPVLRVNSYELRTAFDAYLQRRGPASPVKTFAALVQSGKYLKGGTLELRFQDTMKVATLDANEKYLSVLETQRTVRRLLVELLNRYSLDALVYPVKALPAPRIGASDDGPRDNSISATTGLPAIIVPAGVSSEGLPLALEILGRPFSESTLIQLAHSVERITDRRIVPKTVPTLPGEVFAY